MASHTRSKRIGNWFKRFLPRIKPSSGKSVKPNNVVDSPEDPCVAHQKPKYTISGPEKERAKKIIRKMYDDYKQYHKDEPFDRRRRIEGLTNDRKPTLGFYRPRTNKIVLYKGSNLGTLFEELFHFKQVQKLKQMYTIVDPKTIEKMERAVAKVMKDLGFKEVK